MIYLLCVVAALIACISPSLYVDWKDPKDIGLLVLFFLACLAIVCVFTWLAGH
jgi:hypothetical protein